MTAELKRRIVYISDEQWDDLRREAQRTGESMSERIRERLTWAERGAIRQVSGDNYARIKRALSKSISESEARRMEEVFGVQDPEGEKAEVLERHYVSIDQPVVPEFDSDPYQQGDPPEGQP